MCNKNDNINNIFNGGHSEEIRNCVVRLKLLKQSEITALTRSISMNPEILDRILRPRKKIKKHVKKNEDEETPKRKSIRLYKLSNRQKAIPKSKTGLIKINRLTERNKLDQNSNYNESFQKTTEIVKPRRSKRFNLEEISDNFDNDNSKKDSQQKNNISHDIDKKKVTKIEKTKNVPSTDSFDVYEFRLSQPSTSNHHEEISIIKKLAKEGKVRIQHKRQINNQNRTKKKYINSASIWHNIEKELGINATRKNKKLNLSINNNPKTITKLHDKTVMSMHDTHNNKTLHNEQNSTKNKSAEKSKSVENLHDNKSVKLVDNEKCVENDDTLTHNELSSVPEAKQDGNDSGILPFDEHLNDLTLQNIKEKENKKPPPTINTRQRIKDKEALLKFAQNYVKSNSNSSTPVVYKKNIKNIDFSPILLSPPSWQSKTPTPILKNQSTNDFDSLKNAENIPPRSNEQNQKTMDIFKTPGKTLITSQKTSVQRNPLKQINILEIIELPHLDLNNKKEILQNVSEVSKLNTPRKMKIDDHATNNKNIENCTTENYFGFEVIEENEPEESNSKAVLPEKTKFKRKLKSLKKLVSNEKKRIEHKNIPAIFGESSTKQANIREMLCSTMIETKSGDDSNVNLQESTIVGEANDSSSIDNLFDDPINPETTFDTTKVNKTYSRRKRQHPKNFFLFFSEDESDVEIENDKKIRKMRKKHNDFDEKEFDEFAEKTNTEFEEALNYEIPTEIDKSLPSEI